MIGRWAATWPGRARRWRHPHAPICWTIARPLSAAQHGGQRRRQYRARRRWSTPCRRSSARRRAPRSPRLGRAQRPGRARASRLLAKETEQTNSASACPALSYTDPDRYVQQMLDGVLGGGMSSRLFVEIREKRALAYTVGLLRGDLARRGRLHRLCRRWTTSGWKLPGRRAARTGPRAPGAGQRTELQKVKEYHKGPSAVALESSRAVAGVGAGGRNCCRTTSRAWTRCSSRSKR